ncbi:uncharacterized protein LOC6034278 isoform X3 [Culex quinquefasciatus]|uniref:uncharacterized protein LOC6034278 isoform X3 n=1 Tax=Culex quinquefasciatus TaxID=7176 RepID=UPI0018E30F0C|nr:uncharacterized protein LOC6034278 isoform X3 [Culex quinquefasciatus]
MPKSLASFCRLCLTKTASKVPVFGGDQENVTNLLALIELSIDPESEANAAVCLSCIVTLEAFHQFKQQCHDNERFLKTVPWKDHADVSEANEEDADETAMECDFLEEACDDTRDSEDEGLVEFVELPSMAKKKVSVASLKKQVETPKATQMQPEKLITSRRENIFLAEPSSRVRKQIARPVSSPRTDLIEKSKALEEKFRPPEPTEDDLPKLKDSYPDYFHFEKKPHAKFFTLVYYGERFNSAVYEPEKTYYRCAYKRKFQCPAVLNVTNDYTEFVRRLEHNHDEQEPKKSKIMPVLLTPRQALPTIFRKCWRKVEQKKVQRQHQHARLFRKYKKKSKKAEQKKPTKKQSNDSESQDSDDDFNEDDAWW